MSPETQLELMVVFVLVVLVVNVLVTLTTDRFYTRRIRRSVKAREDDAKRLSSNATKRIDAVKVRERAVAEAERNLRRTAKEVSARNPFENADTVEMAKVEL